MSNRPAIPAELERRVKVEAGHRCAIPACQQTPIEIAHIDACANVREHRFENLIALCPTCHSQYDNTKQIDRKSMLQYKANLAIMNSRYADIERRILQIFAVDLERASIALPGEMAIFVLNLLKDALLESSKPVTVWSTSIPVAPEVYRITDQGRIFAKRWFEGQQLG